MQILSGKLKLRILNEMRIQISIVFSPIFPRFPLLFSLIPLLFSKPGWGWRSICPLLNIPLNTPLGDIYSNFSAPDQTAS